MARESVAARADLTPDPTVQERFGERPVQGKVKHTILRQYAGAWAGIIMNGVRRDAVESIKRGDAPPRLDLVYVDGFGGAGQYERDFDGSPGPIWGSPIIGVQALEDQTGRATQFEVRVTAFVSEQHRGCHAALIENLRAANLRTPIVEVDEFRRDGFGKVNVLRGDFRDQLAALERALGSGASADPFVLHFIDPYGPTMSMAELQRLLGRKRTDAIVCCSRITTSRSAADRRQRTPRTAARPIS